MGVRGTTVMPLTPDAAVLDGIASLVDKSLVQQTATTDGEPRFRMLETIREYGVEQLAAAGESDATMQRLAGWCRSLLEGVEEAFFTAMQGRWVERLETEHDNLRAVLAWAIERGDATTAHSLIEKLGWFWIPRGYLSEGRTWGERALALGDTAPTPGRAWTLALTGTFAWMQGDHQRARELAVEGLSLSRQIGHVIGEGNSLSSCSVGRQRTKGDSTRRKPISPRPSGTFGRMASPTWVGFSLNYLGHVEYERGDVERATVRFEEARDIFRTTGNTYGIGFVLANLAKTARRQGDYPRATALYAESLVLRYEQGDKQSIASSLRGLASRRGRNPAVADAPPASGERRTPCARRSAHRRRDTPPGAQEAIAATRRGLGEEAFAAAWAAGRALTLAEAVAEALDDLA